MEISKDFSSEKERLKSIVSERQKKLYDIEDQIKVGDNRKEIIEKYTNLEYLTREIVDTLIDYISVGKRFDKNQPVPVEIHWKF